MPRIVEGFVALVMPLRDVLILVLGALITLLSTLLVQDRRAKDELRAKILSGTMTRLAELEDLIALLATQAGLESLEPLMVMLAGSPAQSAWRDKMSPALERLSVLAHTFRRYQNLTTAIVGLVYAGNNVLSATLPPFFQSDPKEPADRGSALAEKQQRLGQAIIRIQIVVDRIIENDLRSDLTFGNRLRAAGSKVIIRLAPWLRRRKRGAPGAA